MRTVLRFAAQALLYVPFLALIGYFSTSPAYRHLEDGQALIRLSISHAAQRVGECRRRTPDELARMPPNMRAPLECPRERAPMAVELEVDGELVYRVVAPPSGLSRDGAATVYKRIPITAGKHHIAVRLNDRVAPDFNYEHAAVVDIAAGRMLVIDFDAGQGGFLVRH